MPPLPHLPLVRVEYQDERRKGGSPRTPQRAYNEHGQALHQQLDAAVATFKQQHPPAGINPELILRIKLRGTVAPDTWAANNLTIVGQNDDGTWALFASNADLTSFASRLARYQAGPPEGQKGAPHAGLFANIDEIARLQPEDRIGRLFRADGLTQPNHIKGTRLYTIDVELWPNASIAENRVRLNAIKAFVAANNGRVTDEYVSPSLVLARVKVQGELLRALLALDAISVIDLPPRISLRVSQQLDVSLQDLQPVTPPMPNATGICVVDSGIASAHPLLAPAVGEATVVSPTIKTATDGNGHGTRVAGLALYGNVGQCIDDRHFVPTLRLFSARVLNDDNGFDDDKLITTQMVNAIEYFRTTYGCRVFNLSLGDDRLPYSDGKVSAWASILDHLSRQHDIVIVVSAGNYSHDPDPARPETEDISGYPRYLLEPPARIIEPATGAIVLTVGSLASSATLPASAANRANVRPIALPEQPSPFTRSGPGIGGGIKPELCEYGGNAAIDIQANKIVWPEELSIISLNKNYLQRLFSTGNGTSLAAPRVAHIAAKVLQQFPDVSANLIRALTVASARIPEAAVQVLSQIKGATLRLCGYGLPSLERATASDPNRVVMHATGKLPFDMFHIFEVPIPQEFYEGTAERRISVTLAFDPPVRHSRIDYVGTSMSFRLIRGKSLDEVAQAFKKRQPKGTNAESITDSCNCTMTPGPNERDGGTLQRATFTMKRAADRYGDTYYVVVRCERGWALDEHGPQRYAVVVSLESDEKVDLYARIQARVEMRGRLRARV